MVGHHIEDSRLPVYIRYYPNGALNARVYREDVSDEVQSLWTEFFKQRGSLTLDKIKYDAEIFKNDEVDIDSLNPAEKKQRLEKYLLEKGVANPKNAATSGEFMTAEQQPKTVIQNGDLATLMEDVQQEAPSGGSDVSEDLHVGHLIENPSIKVYAFVKIFQYATKSELRLCFRAHRNDDHGEVLGDEEGKDKRFWRYGGM